MNPIWTTANSECVQEDGVVPGCMWQAGRQERTYQIWMDGMDGSKPISRQVHVLSLSPSLITPLPHSTPDGWTAFWEKRICCVAVMSCPIPPHPIPILFFFFYPRVYTKKLFSLHLLCLPPLIATRPLTHPHMCVWTTNNKFKPHPGPWSCPCPSATLSSIILTTAFSNICSFGPWLLLASGIWFLASTSEQKREGIILLRWLACSCPCAACRVSLCTTIPHPPSPIHHSTIEPWTSHMSPKKKKGFPPLQPHSIDSNQTTLGEKSQ